MRDPTKENLEALEAIIDSIGLDATVLAVESICYAKAEHLAVNWQDAYSAKLWNRAGNHLDKVVTLCKNLGLTRD